MRRFFACSFACIDRIEFDLCIISIQYRNQFTRTHRHQSNKPATMKTTISSVNYSRPNTMAVGWNRQQMVKFDFMLVIISTHLQQIIFRLWVSFNVGNALSISFFSLIHLMSFSLSLFHRCVNWLKGSSRSNPNVAHKNGPSRKITTPSN